MREPTPLKLYPLREAEILQMRDILKDAKAASYFEQNRFIRGGGDIRNFLREGDPPRLSMEFAATLYNYVMEELWKQAYEKSDRALAEKIERLHDLGMEGPRYDTGINKYMDGLVGNIDYYNVPPSEQKIYIGYRFKTDKSVVLRFYTQIFQDKEIGRTRFWSFLKMNLAEGKQAVTFGERRTEGFAYHWSGNIYLSGFINEELGVEFIAFRRTLDKRTRSGVVTTTAITGIPAAKKCVLVEASYTKFWDDLGPELKEGRVRPGMDTVGIVDKMHPSAANEIQKDFKPEFAFDVVGLISRTTADGQVDPNSIDMIKIIDY
jgi:hypothetical protein